MLPKVLNWVQVWTLRRPLQNTNFLCLKKIFCYLARVFWVIILLKNPALWHFSSSMRKHFIGDNISVDRAIHDSFDAMNGDRSCHGWSNPKLFVELLERSVFWSAKKDEFAFSSWQNWGEENLILCRTLRIKGFYYFKFFQTVPYFLHATKSLVSGKLGNLHKSHWNFFDNLIRFH